jgi:hypothetical protein
MQIILVDLFSLADSRCEAPFVVRCGATHFELKLAATI